MPTTLNQAITIALAETSVLNRISEYSKPDSAPGYGDRAEESMDVDVLKGLIPI